MECPSCLKENQQSIKKFGYGRNFISSYINCKIHNPIYLKKLNHNLLKYFSAFLKSPYDS